MEQERFVVIDNKKGVLIPLMTEKEENLEKNNSCSLDEKVGRVHMLMKALIRQAIKDTIKEYHFQILEEIKEYEKNENLRWAELRRREEERWNEIEKTEKVRWENFIKKDKEYKEKVKKEEEKRWKELEKHFEVVDKNIREKQMFNKRKKGP